MRGSVYVVIVEKVELPVVWVDELSNANYQYDTKSKHSTKRLTFGAIPGLCIL